MSFGCGLNAFKQKLHSKFSQHVVTAPYRETDHTFSLFSAKGNLSSSLLVFSHWITTAFGRRMSKMNPAFLTKGFPWNEPHSGHIVFQLKWSSFLLTCRGRASPVCIRKCYRCNCRKMASRVMRVIFPRSLGTRPSNLRWFFEGALRGAMT